jgi:hypothetical protein
MITAHLDAKKRELRLVDCLRSGAGWGASQAERDGMGWMQDGSVVLKRCEIETATSLTMEPVTTI